MTKNEIREALRGNDQDLAVALLHKVMNAATMDDAIAVLEDIQAGERANAVEDICIDLKDFGQTESVKVIKANY
jgi:hypothetical protein